VRLGWYVYVGSALGPGGLAAKVGRHLGGRKMCRWHTAYLRAVILRTLAVFQSVKQVLLRHFLSFAVVGASLKELVQI